MTNRLFPQILIALALVATAVLSRLLIDEPNFAAAGAVALFSGFVFRNRLLAIATPMLAMVLSDVMIGFYAPTLMAGVYASLALGVALGWFVRSRSERGQKAWPWAAGAALVGSVMFFVLSNFFVWLGSGGYDRSLSGLTECYAAAVPFFRNTLASDAMFSAALFATHALVTRRTAITGRRAAQPA